MRKEVIIAILLGFGLGLVITFGVWTANKALKKEKKEQAPIVAEKEEAKPSPSPSFSLEILSPEDESISAKDKATITGVTKPKSVISFAYEKGEDLIEADEDGNFEIEIPLVSGINEIEITAFGLEGEEETKKLNIVYSTAEI